MIVIDIQMELDRKLGKKKNQEDANNVPNKNKAEGVGKTMGCSSLMMKNFENNANLIKLGIHRVTNLGTNQTPVNNESYSNYSSPKSQASSQTNDWQKQMRENQENNTQMPSQTLLRNIKVASVNAESNTNGSTGRVGRPPKNSTNVCKIQSTSPNMMKKQPTNNSTTKCPIFAPLSPTSKPMTGNVQNAKHHKTQRPTRTSQQQLHGYVSQGSEESSSIDTGETSMSRETSEDKTSLSREDSEDKRTMSAEGNDTSDFSTNLSYYSTVFDKSDESLPYLKKLFISSPNTHNQEESFKNEEKFEWIPSEPDEKSILSTTGELLDLFEDNFEEDCDGSLVSTYYNKFQNDLDIKLNNLSSIHESLYTSSDSATLRTLEKFLLQLLQQKNNYGNLTSFGKLLAFINLSFLKKHMNLLDSLYCHPEMSVIRNVLSTNAKGQISKTISNSAGIPETSKNSQDDTTNVITQVLNNKDGTVTQPAIRDNIKNKYLSSGMRQNRQRLTILDSLSGMYKPGGEPHFPRYVCGSIDRTLVVNTETLSIPFEKSDKRNVHVQFEKFDKKHSEMWPKTTTLPQNISEGTIVQVAPLKYSSLMTWKAGMVVSLSSGQLMIKIPNEQKERLYLMRNFVPPNLPVVKLEKGYWRLMPRELDITRDLYVGSCLSLLEVAEPDESVDVVVLNVFYSQETSPIAPVKPPSDETSFQYSKEKEYRSNDERLHLEYNYNLSNNNNNYYNSNKDCNSNNNNNSNNSGDNNNSTNGKWEGESRENERTCSCNGYTLRVFEGKFLGIPERILVHSLHDKKEHILKVKDLKGFKLNYDVQSHFDGPTGTTQFPSSVWVVPRNISFLGDTFTTKDSQKAGYAWLFKPEYCLVMFPFSRNIDVLQDLYRLIPFLHPELNYLALCAGLWSLRNKPETKEREAISYTRSQKAAIRDLTSNDVVSEVCSDVARVPCSLTRRLYGCFPVISMWIALDEYDPEGEMEAKIPTNIKIPKPEECEKCKGNVISKTGMVKIISNKYTQLLSKKLSRRTKESSSQSQEMASSLDDNAKGNSDNSDKEAENSDRELDTSDKDTSVVEGESQPKGSKPKEVLNKEKEKLEKLEKEKEKERENKEQSSEEFQKRSDDIFMKKDIKSFLRRESELLNGGRKEDFEMASEEGRRESASKKIFEAIFSPEPEDETSPVLCDLEKAEEWVKRLQTLATSRWRLTKEFNASYTVDDEFSIVTSYPANESKVNSEFLIQLAGLMSNVKKGREVSIDTNLVYKLYQLSEECSSTTEGALLTGWSSYILSEQRPPQLEEYQYPPNTTYATEKNTKMNKGEYGGHQSCPLNFKCPRGPNCPCATSGPNYCPLRALNTNSLNSPQQQNKVTPQMNGPIKKSSTDLSNNYSRLLINNPILGDMSKYCKRKRDDQYKKLTAFNKTHKNNQSLGTLLNKVGEKNASHKGKETEAESDNPYINDPYDFCKFTDKPQRKKFISSLKWDEDIEF